MVLSDRISIWRDQQCERLLAQVYRHVAEPGAELGSKLTRTPRSLIPVSILLVAYGLQMTEIVRLRRSDWDPVTRTLTIQQLVQGRQLARLVVVDHATAGCIATEANRRQHGEVLFAVWHGSPWTVRMLQRRLREVLRAAELRGEPWWCRNTAIARLRRPTWGAVEPLVDPASILGIALAHLRTIIPPVGHPDHLDAVARWSGVG